MKTLATRDGHLVAGHPQQTETPNGLTIWFWATVCGTEGSGIGSAFYDTSRFGLLITPPELDENLRCATCWRAP